MRLLVYHAGALGDFVTIVPALRAARALLPGARVTLLGRPSFGGLAAAFSLVDETLDAGSAGFASVYAGSPSPEAAAALGQYDLAFLFSASAGLLAAAKELAGRVFHHPPFPEVAVSAYEYHLRFVLDALRGHASREELLRPPLLPPSGGARASRCVIHPGSGSRAKSWPPERTLALAEGLRQRGLDVIWSFGPADAEARACIEPRLAPGDGLVGAVEPLELARVLSGASLFVGMDSGVTHLAAAVGCPTIALFGPTSEAVWRPPGAHVRVVSRRDRCPAPAGGACAIPPRGERCGRTSGGVADCILAVELPDVLRAVDELLPGTAPRGSMPHG